MPEEPEYAPDCETVEDSKLKLPSIKIEKKETSSGEENEDIVYAERSRLFLFFAEDKYGEEVRKNIWKERGTGEVRILKDKSSQKIRIVMRQEKTLKIILNHIINPMTCLKPNAGSNRSWCFLCEDFADGEVKQGFYAIRFKDEDTAKAFKKTFDESRESNAKVFGVKVDLETGKLIEEASAETTTEPEAAKKE